MKRFHDDDPSESETDADSENIESPSESGDHSSVEPESESEQSDAEEVSDEYESDDDPDAVFGDLIQKVKVQNANTESLNLECLKDLFREEYKNTLLWIHALKQSPTHKKVMQTAKELRESADDYDYEESIEAAIDRRKHLLNRLVSESEVVEEESDNSMSA